MLAGSITAHIIILWLSACYTGSWLVITLYLGVQHIIMPVTISLSKNIYTAWELFGPKNISWSSFS